MSDETSSSSVSPKRTSIRQSRSCRVCRIRKVKCDRVKPCQACCAHGHPSKCIFDDISDDDLRPISQADEIRNLRAEIKELRRRIESQGNRPRNVRRLVQLEAVYDSIRAAPMHVVDDIIADIRSSRILSATKRRVGTETPQDGLPADDSAWTTAVFLRRQQSRTSRSGSADDVSEEEVIDTDRKDDRLVPYDFSRHPSSDWTADASERYDSDDSGSDMVRFSMSTQRPAVDVFVERFVDAFSPEVDIKSGRAGAIRAAAGIRMFSPLLSSAFEAVSVAYFGRSIQDRRIEGACRSLYGRVLRSLQEALNDPEYSKAESTLVTVILLMAFESVELTAPGSVATHVLGAMRLIKYRGPENHVHGVEHLLFAELRPYWVGGALVRRKPSFLAREEWKTIPWSAATTEKDILHYLLDLAVEVPALLSQYDELEAARKYSRLGPREFSAKQTALWHGVADLTERYYQWKKDWVDNYPDGPLREVESQRQPGDTNTFPVFRYREPKTGRIVQPTTFVYPNLRLAQTMCLYYATRLILATVDTRPSGRVTGAERFALACGICRSLEWYIRTAPGNMINRLAFTVRIAWEVFEDGGPERHFIQQVLQLVERRHALGLWGSAMPEFSPWAEPPRVME